MSRTNLHGPQVVRVLEIRLYFQPYTSSFSTDLSKAVPLLQLFFVRASVVSYMVFVVSLFVPHLSFFSGRLCFVDVLSWESSLLFLANPFSIQGCL